LAGVSSVAASLGAVSGLESNFAAGDFTITGNSCTGNLAANASCTIDINFTPTTTGLRQAAVTVTDSAGDTLSFNIEGTNNTLAFLPPPHLVCSPAVPPGTVLVFCNAEVGTTSPAQTFTLSSPAAIPGLNISLAAVAGLTSEFDASQPDFTWSTPCGAMLGAAATCDVNVAFRPKTAGLREAA